MVFKLIGAVLTLLGFALTGNNLGKSYLKRSQQIRMMINYLDYMQSEIRYRQMKLPEICNRIVNSKLNNEVACLGMFYKVCECLSVQMNWQEAWTQGIYILKKETLLKEEDIWPLLELMDYGIDMDRQRLDGLLEQCKMRMMKQEDKLLIEYQNKEKVFRSLGIFAGFMSVIILF